MTNDINVGDILAGTWGYSMTIPCFYKVTKITPTGCKVIELAKYMCQSTDGMYHQQGYELPLGTLKGRDATEQFARYVPKFNEFKVGSSKQYTARYLHKWDGRPVYADYCD